MEDGVEAGRDDGVAQGHSSNSLGLSLAPQYGFTFVIGESKMISLDVISPDQILHGLRSGSGLLRGRVRAQDGAMCNGAVQDYCMQATDR